MQTLKTIIGDDAAHENKKRFATVDKEELKRILKEKDAMNTRRATDLAVKTFRAYLRGKGTTQEFEDLPKV